MSTLAKVEQDFIDHAYKMWETIRNMPKVSQGSIKISISGMTEGEKKYTATVNLWNGTSWEEVSSNNLESALEESMRRGGFVQMHQALCLPNVRDTDITVVSSEEGEDVLTRIGLRPTDNDNDDEVPF